jgi:hypothetical protein
MVFFKFLYSEKSGDEVGTMKSAIDRIIMPEASMVRLFLWIIGTSSQTLCSTEPLPCELISTYIYFNVPQVFKGV